MRAVIVIYNKNFCDIIVKKVNAACDAYAFPLAVEIVRDGHQVLHSLVVYDIYFIALGKDKNLGMALAEGLRKKRLMVRLFLLVKMENI